MTRQDPPIEATLDDDGISLVCAGRKARIEVHDEGFCVRGGSDPLVRCPGDGYGLRWAAYQARDRVLSGRKRPALPASAGLFAREHVVLEGNPGDALQALLARVWVERALAIAPACAPLFGHRRYAYDVYLCASPLFLRTPWLLDDALRFRGARTIWASQRWPREVDSFEAFRARIGELHLWRRAFMPGGGRPSRALHVTLDHGLPPEVLPGDVAAEETRHDEHPREAGRAPNADVPDSPEARAHAANELTDRHIRFLSRIHLVMPLQSELHLALLVELLPPGAHVVEGEPARLLDLVQRTSREELEACLQESAQVFGIAGADTGTVIHTLAMWLRRDFRMPPAGTLRALVRQAAAALDDYRYNHPDPELRRLYRRHHPGLARHRDAAAAPRESRPLPRPPCPLPNREGVRFLENTDDVYAEASAMHHCIATRIPFALAGQAFLFHIERYDTKASVEVDHEGRVTDARGPCNHINAAARYGREALGRWGLWLAAGRAVGSHDPDFSLVNEREGEGYVTPPGVRVLSTLGQLVAALRVMPFPPPLLRTLVLRGWAACKRVGGRFVEAGGVVGVLNPAGRTLVYVEREPTPRVRVHASVQARRGAA